jgi:hypothetical protein
VFQLSDEQIELRSLAARLGSELYAPHAREWDESRSPLPDHERKRLAELGLLALTGESPLLSPPGFRVVLESGLFDPDSVDLAGHRGVGVPACRSVLGRGSVAQRGVAVSVVVFVFEVADDHSGLEQGVPVVAVETLLA